ncbi:hypothetical protein MRX96_048432 [Rhipicephalus microplus]
MQTLAKGKQSVSCCDEWCSAVTEAAGGIRPARRGKPSRGFGESGIHGGEPYCTCRVSHPSPCGSRRSAPG